LLFACFSSKLNTNPLQAMDDRRLSGNVVRTTTFMEQIITSSSCDENYSTPRLAPIIGLHAHGWDDEPARPQVDRPQSWTRDEMRRWDEPSRQNWRPGTWNSEEWRQDAWTNDASGGWETDIPTDSDIWKNSSNSNWPEHNESSLWTTSVKPNNVSIWVDPGIDGRWVHPKTNISVPTINNNPGPTPPVYNNSGWNNTTISHLRDRNNAIEQYNKMLEANVLELQQQHDLLASQLVDKIQEIERFDEHEDLLRQEIKILKDRLEVQEKQGLLSLITDRLKRLTLSDLEEVSLHTQELIIKKKKEQRESRLCVVCIDQERTNVVIPCGHFCLCEFCTEQLPKPIKCPVCRGGAREIVRVYA